MGPWNVCFELWCWRRLLSVTWTSRRSNQSILKEMRPDIHWKDWCWSWNSNTLAIWCWEQTYWKRPCYWERLRAGGEGDYRGWDGWTVSPTQWTWVCASSGGWWRTGKPGELQSMGSRVGHDWTTGQQQNKCQGKQFTVLGRMFNKRGLNKPGYWGFMVAQWLRLCLPVLGVQVPSLVRRLSSHMPWCQQSKIQQK